MICKRLFYSVFYILFIYRSNFVISNSTSAVPVESGSAHVDPSATPVDPNGGAPIAGSVAMAATTDPNAAWVAAASPEPNAALTGAQPVAAPVAQGVAMTAPVNQAAPVVNQASPVANQAIPYVNQGAPAVNQAAPVVNQGAPAVNLGVPAAPMAGVPPSGPHVAHSVPTTPVSEPNAAMAVPVAGHQEMSALAGATAVINEPNLAMTAAHLGAQVGSNASPSTLSGVPLLKATPPAGPSVASHDAAGAPAMPAHMPSGSQFVASPGAGVPVAGAPLAGAHIAGAHLAQAAPVLSASDPNAAMTALPHVESQVQPLTAQTPGTNVAMGAPIVGAPVAMVSGYTASAPALGTPMTFGAQATPGASATTHVAPGAHFVASPTTGPQDLASTFTQGTLDMSSPVNYSSQIVTTPATLGAPSVTINLGNLDHSSSPSLEKIMVDIILNKKDSDKFKYRRDDPNGTDIFYAKEGFIFNEIQMNGTKKWPPDGEIKECKKVLYIINPVDRKKTLRVIYPDETDAYDPDYPPTRAASTPIPSPLSEPTAAYSDPNEFTQYQTASLPAGSATVPDLDSVLAATDPTDLDSAPQDQHYKVDQDGQVYLEFTVSKGQESDEQGSGASGSSAFKVEEIRAPRGGRTLDYHDSDDEFIPGDDDDTPVDLTTYVTTVGRRVRALENRMDSTEDTLKLLVRTLDYQHELLEFRRKFGVKTAPFGADFGRHSFYDPEAFKPATSLVSKVLDASEHPSDIKLFVLGADSKLAELTHDKFKVKQEGEEIHYDFQMDVECKLVTFKDRTVWHHRENDPHPLGVVFHPDDDKVVVDFDDAIVMYVKKGELPEGPVKKSIVDIPLGKLDSEGEEANKETEDDATALKTSEDVKDVAKDAAQVCVSMPEASLAPKEDAGHATDSSQSASVTVHAEPAHSASVPADPAHAAQVAHAAPVTSVPASTPAPLGVATPVAQAAPLTASQPTEASATPDSHTASVSSANPEAQQAEASPTTLVLTDTTPAANNQASATPAQDASEGAPTV